MTRRAYLKKTLVFVLSVMMMVIAITGCSGSNKNNTTSSPSAESTDESSDDISGEDNLGGEGSEITTVPQDTVIITIDDKKITLKDMMYWIFMTEQEYDSQALYFEMLGYEFWDEKVEEGGSMTYRDAAKQSVIDFTIFMELMYDKAMEAGLTLTQENKDVIQDEINYTLEIMDEVSLKRTGFTEEYIREAFTKYLLAMQYYETELAKIEVDEEAIKAEYDYELYRVYDLEYLCIPIGDYDDDGNFNEYDEAKKKEGKAKAKELLTKVLAGTTLEEAYGEDETVEYGTMPITKEDSGFDVKVVEQALKLENNDIYDKVIEGSDGYYIIKMLNNSNDEEYLMQIESSINEEKAGVYEGMFDELRKQYAITVDEKNWAKVDVQNYAFPKTSTEEMEGIEFPEDTGTEDETVDLEEESGDALTE